MPKKQSTDIMFTILEDQEHTACLPGLVWEDVLLDPKAFKKSPTFGPVSVQPGPLDHLGLVSVVRITPIGHEWPFGNSTTRSLGGLAITMDMNHLPGMILQVNI